MGDPSFSGGAAAGDINGDGFPDVYVANLGANRLYLNNGDGTFAEASAESGLAGSEWTLSAVIADVNGDRWPDVYDVNYLKGEDLFQRACFKNGRPVQCYPTDFEAEQDRLWVNSGEGRFGDVTESSGIVQPGGKGMGVVAADFDSSRRTSLFVSNDTTANFLFANQTFKSDSGLSRPLPVFEERALLNGLAVDGQGRAQSCMGIAAGDANGDGRLDLFVTNFIGESNTLYLQQADGTFQDQTQAFGLSPSGYHRMGWGTQFLDGELDGDLDLVVANGNLDDYTPEGIPYGMRCLYYQNEINARFLQVPGESLGAYFQSKPVGRAVARLDWNRDGLDDVCVTHVDRPVALLTNTTKKHGHFVAVTLRAVHAEREAIGTIVRLRTGHKILTGQLTAGDGFMNSNQRQLIFGLGKADHIDELEVSWISGRSSFFQNLVADAEYLLIEDRPTPFRLNRD